jgi:Zn-dependent peptidase ImmA (M78 family)/transcriptional regulator with XRE-family HTH domain
MDETREVFSRRLRQARAIRGMSLRDLSEALKNAVSHNALAKYENGEMMPTSETIGIMADVLEQSIDFFFRPFTLSLQEVKFRKRACLSKKAEASIREQAVEYFERYHEIEELLGEIREFEGKLPGKAIAKPEDAEEAAALLRKRWQLGRDPLPNLVELLESRGIKVYETPLEEEDCDGFSADTEAGPVIVLSLKNNVLRKRMTLAHELAHVVLRLADSVSAKDEENVMKRFAGALLLPKESFLAVFGKARSAISLAELIEMKVNFGASIMAIMMRAKLLGLITESGFVRFCQQTGQWRKNKCEPGDDLYRGNETHSRFKQLVQRAVAEDQISMTKGAALVGQNIGTFRRELQEVFV